MRDVPSGWIANKRDENRDRGGQHIGLQGRRCDVEAFESGKNRDGGGDRAITINQRSAKQSDSDDRRPLMFLDAEQRHEGENAAFAVIVDAHREDHIFDRRDDDQRPYDKREDAKDDVRRRRAAGQVENGFEGVKWARPDVSEDNSER